jgi:hypothetical protein
MALDFPANPTNGQIYGSYTYNSTVGAWQSREDSRTVAILSSTVPVSANPGDIWVNTNDGISFVYYDDGTSAQWMELLPSGVPLLDTKADISGDTFTGNIIAPIFISNVATGTAPLTVSSTTAVTNLNADLLDGNHASAFSLTTHTHDDVVSKGALAAETGRSVHDTGIYTFNTNNSSLGDSTPTAYWSTLAWGRGAAGSAELAASWTTNGTELWYRSLRDVVDNWWPWKKIYNSGTGVPAGDITSGTLASARLPSGTVLQVVESGTGANTATVTGQYTWGSTGISATITPRSTSSRIKVTANITASCSAAGWVFMRVLRGSTPVGNGTAGGTFNFSTLTYIADYGRLEPMNACFVDSPATTAATTYTIQFAVYTGTGYLNRRGADALFGSYSNIILEEIA